MTRLLALILLLGVVTPAAAVEPLWGEMPLTLGRSTFHPMIRTRYFDAGNRNSSRMRMWEQELMLEYAPSTALNVRLDIPYLQNIQQVRQGGRSGNSFVSGLGDMTLRAKQRISASRGEGSQSQHSVFYGVKLPTGQDDHHYSFRGGVPRRRLDPIDQSGTGNPGLLLGYGWTGETLERAAWAGITWRRDIGGGFRLGDTLEATGTVAQWVKRPNEAEELGIKLSAGLFGQYHTADTDSRGRSAGNEFGYGGFHFTPVITRGNYILQTGIFVPVVRGGAQNRVDFPFEFRFGIETYF